MAIGTLVISHAALVLLGAAEEKRPALCEHSEFAARPQRILRLLAILACAAGRLAH